MQVTRTKLQIFGIRFGGINSSFN